ncbi:hypothetical protein Tco_1218910 [Tanacetum coccineum]
MVLECNESCNIQQDYGMLNEGGESTSRTPEFDQRGWVSSAMQGCPKMFRPTRRKCSSHVVTDEELLKALLEINKDDIDEKMMESSTMEPPSRNEGY